ncbi:MAG: hypothetical protein ACRD9R_06505 [Pyrinomonadaceae bacterium]
MSKLRALGSGFVGACALTLIHETARRALPGVAPRLDVLGMRAIKKTARAAGDQSPPAGEELRRLALAGDIFSNSLYFSLVGVGGRRQALTCGALLGLSAGVGAVLLPGPLGLGRDASARTPQTQALTVAWYVAGGLAAATTYKLFASNSRR